MADFSTKATDIDTTIEPSATLLQPVSREGEIDALSNIARGVGKVATVVQTVRANSAANEANKFRADFSIKLNSLQDAHDQGTISDSEFRTRSRAILSQTLANSPAQTEDLLQDYSRFQSQSGLDKIAAPGVQRAEIQQAAVKAAVDNGFLSVKDVGNPEAEAAGVASLEKFNTTVREIKQESDAIGLQASKLELGSKQRAEAQAQQQAIVKNGLAKIGRDGVPYWRTQYENVKVRAAQATSEQERSKIIADGIVQMEQDFAQRVASISGDTLNVSQADVDMIIAPQRKLLDAHIKSLNGTYSNETYEMAAKTYENQAKIAAYEGFSQDPTLVTFIGAAKISDAIGTVLAPQIQARITNILKKNADAVIPSGPGGERTKPADILPSSTDEKKTTNEYFNAIKGAMENKASGKFEQFGSEWNSQLDVEINNQMAGILKGVKVHSNAVESAKEFQPVIDFLADPVVGQYLKGKGIPEEMRADVAQVLQDGYATQVIPMLRSELGSSVFNQIRIGQNTYQLNEVFEPTMEGGKFGFKLKPGMDSFAARASLRAVNESAFAKVVNKMIVSNAHIQGNADYNKSYEEVIKPALFPEAVDADGDGEPDQPVDTQTTGSVEQDFNLESLVETASADPELMGADMTTLEGDVKDIATAIDIGETAGSGDYGTLLGFTHRTGRKFDDADITNKTIDELISFSSPGGAYADYSKKQVGRVATPMGRYQIVGKTLRKLKNELGLTGEETFSPELQDKLFLQLLKGRGYTKYKSGEISREQFLSNLQKEWEGLSTSRKSFNALMAAV